ncbi:hypothetical protein GN956_G4122 [Arapaima gigas]
MGKKMKHCLLTLLFLLLESCRLGELQSTIHGVINGSALLPCLPCPASPSEIQWKNEDGFVVFYDNGVEHTGPQSRFVNRYHLYAENGSLQIHGLQMEDSGLFTVNILKGSNQSYAEVVLLVHETVDTHLNVISNTSRDDYCVVVVNCSTIQDQWKVAKCNGSACQETSRAEQHNSSNSLHINISVKNSIICETSNPVTSSSISLTDICPHGTTGFRRQGHRRHRVRLLSYIAAACFVAAMGGALFFRKYRKTFR